MDIVYLIETLSLITAYYIICEFRQQSLGSTINKSIGADD